MWGGGGGLDRQTQSVALTKTGKVTSKGTSRRAGNVPTMVYFATIQYTKVETNVQPGVVFAKCQTRGGWG